MKKLPVLAVAVLLVFSFEVSANTFTVSGGGFDGIIGAERICRGQGSYLMYRWGQPQ